MRVLDLFSGIGGFSLGLERAGMQTIQFVEIDPFCQRVLRHHWPDVPIHDDIRTFNAPAGFADVICGGFPCQDISFAGGGAGLAGARSGLWREYARIIGEVRPRFVIVENVAALLARGLGEVLGDLAALGLDAEWHCIPASAVGAPHRRDRLWLVAYADSQSTTCRVNPGIAQRSQAAASAGPVESRDTGGGRARLRAPDVADAGRKSAQVSASRELAAVEVAECASWWATEPDVGRVADGVPARVDRLKSLGNAVVPQIPEIIGCALMAHANAKD